MAASVAINGIVKSFQFGAKLWGQLRVPSGAAKTFTQSIAKSADDVAKASAKVADDAVKATARNIPKTADDFAKTATKSADDVAKNATNTFADATKNAAQSSLRNATLTTSDKVVIGTVKKSMLLKLGAAGFVGGEIASGYVITKNAAEAGVVLEEWLREQELDGMADIVKETGLSAFSIIGSIKDFPRDSWIAASAAIFDAKGYHEEANAARIINTVTKPSGTIISLLQAEEGEKTESYLNWVIKDSGVEKNEIRQFLENNPSYVSLINNDKVLDIDLNEIFPGIVDTSPQAPKLAGATEQTPSANTAIRLKEAAGDKLDQAKENGSELMQDFQNASFGQIIFNLVKTLFNAIGLGFIFENETKAEPQGPDLDLN